MQFSSTAVADSEQQLSVATVQAVAAAVADEPDGQRADTGTGTGTGADNAAEEEDEGPSYPTDWSGLCNALCAEFPAVSRTDIIGAMGRNDNDGKRAAAELRELQASGEIGGGAPIDDPEYAASHGL